MAKWQSKAQLEEQALQNAKREVIAAVQPQIAQLVATWEASEYPAYSECEKAIGAIIKESSVWQALPKSVQFNSRSLAIQHFMRSGIEKTVRLRKAEQQKQQEAALRDRTVVLDVFTEQTDPGEVARVGTQGQERILTCLSCEYVSGDADENFDGGYRTRWSEPTEEEKSTERYQMLKKALEDDQAYEQRQRAIIEERRQSELAAIRAEGREPTMLEDIFAGTSDN